MKTLKEHFIAQVVGEAVVAAPVGSVVRVMDVGCGTAFYVPALLAQYPEIEYVGVEPIENSFAAAKKNIAGLARAKIHFQLAYDAIPDESESSFDLVFSLSVLEHVKNLDRFIALSASYVKAGGTLVHRYDLGHALYPHSLKERVHVFLGNHAPALLPQRQFVRYVPESEVRALYSANHVSPTKSTYHQMLSAKRLENQLQDTPSTALDELFAWEMKHQTEFARLAIAAREQIFPAVAVWGRKQ